MTTENLGRLEKIENLRSIWETEAGAFTPWLAGEENLKLLGKTVGLDLELEATEKDVGPFRADILCKDTATGSWVLVENQLERTDHTHLGQLLTYAAGLKAVTIIWIADRFTEEHRAALDWLNEITDDRFAFFGLEIELWRIGDSPIAPKFNAVAKPNDWSKTVTTAKRTLDDQTLTGIKQDQLEFWIELRRVMEERGGIVKLAKPHPANWQSFSVGRTNFWLEVRLQARESRLNVNIGCGGPDGKAHFCLLEQDREAIESDLGEPLEWCELPNRKQSYIGLSKRNVDPLDRSIWPKQQEWIAETLETFHAAFSQRVKQLSADNYRPDDSEGNVGDESEDE
jgi:hypothetical protein